MNIVMEKSILIEIIKKYIESDILLIVEIKIK